MASTPALRLRLRSRLQLKHLKQATSAQEGAPVSRNPFGAGLIPADGPAVLVLTSSYVRARETAKPFCDKTGCVATPHPLLHEFSALDPALIEGMSGAERRPIADAYWQEADPLARHGAGSETFVEFDDRVTAFLGELPGLPSDTVLFGHGIWFGLLCWKLLGFSAEGSDGMKAFRRFQRGLTMPNCAVYTVEQLSPEKWQLLGEEVIARRIATAS